MTEVLRAADALQAFCQMRGWRFCFTCSAEDLIVMKAFAARPKDWVDVEGIIVRQAGHLDWNYVDQYLRPLVELKDAPGILMELENRRRQFGD